MSFRAPAGFMKQSRVSVQQGAGWDCLLQPPDPGGTHKIDSAREGAPASLAHTGGKEKLLDLCIFSVLTEKSDVFRMFVQFKNVARPDVR